MGNRRGIYLGMKADIMQELNSKKVAQNKVNQIYSTPHKMQENLHYDESIY